MPAERRTHMVSATFPPEVRSLVEAWQSNPLPVEGSRLGDANADIEHVACLVAPRDRYGALVNLLLMAGGARTLVFVRTRQDTAELAERLANDGFAALPLSGELAQAQRTRTLNAFRSGLVSTLVATDVAARGLDVPDVPMVVQFDPPIDSAVYTHRSGRTGRAGQKGRMVILVPPAAERRIRRMLDDAAVDASWRDVPGPEQVNRVLDERASATLAAVLDDEDPVDDAGLEAARAALDGRDPLRVVARLIARTRTPPPCEPVALAVPASRSAPRATRQPRVQGHRPLAYARFSINWGARHGATPKRLLAHVCRRGGIHGHQIGAIEVTPFATSFEVDTEVAEPFAARVQRRDSRDPHLVIRREGPSGAPPRRNRRFG
jgi:ATP-dependent RNA helicase DeaD